VVAHRTAGAGRGDLRLERAVPPDTTHTLGLPF
jgi:hypothetical protein